MNTREQKLEAFGRLIDILDELRVKCPWDRKQTNDSLRPNTIEETYELCDALIRNDQNEIAKELGDVLLHVLFYAKIGSEKEHFDIADVCNRLSEKLIYRHPHVFGDEAVSSAEEVSKLWEKVKQKEKGGNKTALAGVPSSLPALIKAYRIQDKARALGFDWEERSQVWDKVKEEICEFEAEVDAMNKEQAEKEFGDVLFSLINAARLYGINPDNALELTNQKFIHRFTYLEEKTLKQGRNLKDMSLAEMDAIWEEAKKQENNLRIEQNYSLLHHNTFGIDAHCERYIEYHDVEQLRSALSLLSQGEKWMHIGSGANLLFTDNYHGTIIKSAMRGIEVLDTPTQENNKILVRAYAAENWDNFVEWTIKHNYYGLECLSLIPSEIGASAVQNIGAYGAEAGQFIHCVHAYDTITKQEVNFQHEECQFGYRTSLFKKEPGRYIILYIDFLLNLEFQPTYAHRAIPEGLSSAQEVRDAVIAIRQSKLPDPKVLGSAGSFFMNPIVSSAQAMQILKEYPELPHYPTEDGNVKIPAGWLIDHAGWKGLDVNREQKKAARVHESQALVLVNHGGATGKDIVKLSKVIQEDIFSKFGIELRPEVIFI